MDKKIKVVMQMQSLGVEPRHCKCGGKFSSGETIKRKRKEER